MSDDGAKEETARRNYSRRFMLGSLALAGGYLAVGRSLDQLTFGTPEARAAAPLASKPLIDAHCHIFNCRDVPVAEFMSRVQLREQLYASYGRTGANAVRSFLSAVLGKVEGEDNWWISAVDAKVLRILSYLHALLAEHTPTLESEIATLEAMLNEGKTLDYKVPTASADAEKLRSILTALPEARGYGDIRQQIESRGIARLIAALSEADRAETLEEAADADESAGRAIDRKIVGHLVDIVKQENRNARSAIALKIAQLVYYDRNADASAVVGYLRFLVTNTHSRVEILAQANELFAGASTRAPGSKVRVFTPATLDYTFWLRGLPRSRGTFAEPPVALPSIPEQTRLYGLIARLQPQDTWVHGFVGYDPLRHAVAMFDELKDAHDGKSVCSDAEARANAAWWAGTTENPLIHLRQAITEHGCVGAKLYPPMGFRPINNEEIDKKRGQTWKLDGQSRSASPFGPLAAMNSSFFCRELPGQTGTRLGPLLDRALRQFYRFCLDEDVAIMAHCSRTQGSFGLIATDKRNSPDPRDWRRSSKAYPHLAAERAAPEYWFELLKKPRRGAQDYSKLRLNLAHAGGVWCLGAVRDGAKLDKAAKESLTKYCDFTRWSDGPTWFHQIAAFTGENEERCPNLYADLGDWSDPVAGGVDAERTAIELTRLIAKYPALRYRLLYGSDWLCMGTKTSYRGYFAKMYDLLGNTLAKNSGTSSAAGEIMADIFGRNAVRFLGLTQGQKTRERLENFFGGERDFSVFDELTV